MRLYVVRDGIADPVSKTIAAKVRKMRIYGLETIVVRGPDTLTEARALRAAVAYDRSPDVAGAKEVIDHRGVIVVA